MISTKFYCTILASNWAKMRLRQFLWLSKTKVKTTISIQISTYLRSWILRIVKTQGKYTRMWILEMMQTSWRSRITVAIMVNFIDKSRSLTLALWKIYCKILNKVVKKAWLRYSSVFVTSTEITTAMSRIRNLTTSSKWSTLIWRCWTCFLFLGHLVLFRIEF